MRRCFPLAMCLFVLPAVAAAQTCEGGSAPMTPDGRVLGHLPYGDISAELLVPAPDGFALGRPCMIRAEVLPDLERLLAAAAADPSVGGALRGLSCHRGIIRQSEVFCREFSPNAANRAISVAPPGHSEHASGYAIDFAVRPSPNCPDAEACMAATAPARWLRLNAPLFGFELSFPPGNTQRVKWEPWHWRWVGPSADAPGAARARFTFAVARTRYPADPAVVAPPRVVATIVVPAAVPVTVAPGGKERKRKR
jgi:D-alanyl-D-alanine carboxypeptidase